jgi:hypothetical protein
MQLNKHVMMLTDEIYCIGGYLRKPFHELAF